MVAPYLGALALVFVATALVAVVSADARVANVSIIYLPAVLLTAVRFGRGPAVLASVAAFLLYDVLFVDPRFHITVADPREWIALLLLLVTAVVTGQLAGDQRARASLAERRERETRLLYDVARLFGGSDLDRALGEAAERVRRELDLAAVALHLSDGERWISAGEDEAQRAIRATDPSRTIAPGRAPTAEDPSGPARGVRIVPPYAARPRSGPSAAPLVARGKRIGTLLALDRGGRRPSPDRDRVLLAVADQFGSAIEREDLRRDSAEAEVLRRADEARSALLHAASHDLRTPLASIIAGATSLRQRDVAWSDEEREEFLAGIEEEARRLDHLVGDLLSVSRIEAGSLRPSKEWHDVADLVDDVVGRARGRAPRQRISVDVPADLPPAFLDLVQIGQALANLLENAIKYAPEDSEVVVRVRAGPGSLSFAVADRGPGVPAGSRDRIFRPFERAGRAEGPPGTGLGLAVAKSFVEAHGGRIWVEPNAEQGSTFAFTVPVSA